jgi:hypothetical protein
MTIKFLTRRMKIGWSNLHYLLLHEADILKDPQFNYLRSDHTLFWDVGCSFGLWSLYAAAWSDNPFSRVSTLSPRVIAFDLSPKAAALCRKNTKGYPVLVVPKPLTLTQQFYRVPWTAHQENKVQLGSALSIDWAHAQSQFGTPTCIKMDTEGGELEFLKSDEFWAWIQTHRIQIFIECHSPEAAQLCERRGLTMSLVRRNHYYSS